MAEKTSLEKSHSKTSNFKLTMICLLASLGVSALWVGIALAGTNRFMGLGIAGIACGAIVTVFSIFLIGRFTR